MRSLENKSINTLNYSPKNEKKFVYFLSSRFNWDINAQLREHKHSEFWIWHKCIISHTNLYQTQKINTQLQFRFPKKKKTRKTKRKWNGIFIMGAKSEKEKRAGKLKHEWKKLPTNILNSNEKFIDFFKFANIYTLD